MKLIVMLCMLAPAARAQYGGLQASNRLNPNVSAVGWIQAEAGGASEEAAAVREVELAFQSVVDPYARADVFVSLADGTAEAEEAYLTWLALPVGLKAGKFHSNFGAFNRIHAPETAFADRPLVYERYFGEESLTAAGVSVDALLPIGDQFFSLDLEAGTPGESGPAFDRGDKKDLLYVGRVRTYRDLTEAANVSLGGSFAYGPTGNGIDKTRLAGVDLVVRWKNPRRAIYRSFRWHNEALRSWRDLPAGPRLGTWGMFSHVEWQFARRWRLGGRFDHSESPSAASAATGGLAYLTFDPSEFSRISLQGKVVEEGGDTDTAVFLKSTFSIGPHGPHAF